MTIDQGQLINSVDFNTIRNKFYNIFGKGTGPSGYGQPEQAATVDSGNRITNGILSTLRNDMIKARQHQSGTSVGDSISNDGNNLFSIKEGDIITAAIVSQYNSFANTIEQNKFLANSNQLSQQTLVDATRSTPWIKVITHSIVVSASEIGDGSYNNFRYFFNAGGKLEFSVARGGGSSSAKNSFWTELLNSIGIISFNYAGATNTGAKGIANPIGFYSLTSTDQVIYSITGSGVYERDYFKILARLENNTKLIFSVIFADDESGDSINGSLTSKLVAYKPSGNNVSVLDFSATHSGIDYGVVPVQSTVSTPTPVMPVIVPVVTPEVGYTISATVYSVNEGGSCTIELICSDTTPRTLYWTTAGNVNNNDFVDNMLTGTINIGSDGKGTLIRNIREDKVTEAVREYFHIEVRTNSISGKVVATTRPIYIEDTSVYELVVDKTSVSEGESVTYTVTSTSLANGTTLYISIAGVSSDDIVGGTAPIPITFQNGTATGSITVATDLLSDGSEEFFLQLISQSPADGILATSNRITVIDNSPAVSISFDSVSTNITANSVINFTIHTANIPNSTILYITMIGTVVNSDIINGLNKTVVVNNNIATGSYTVANLTNFGTKKLSLQVRTASYNGTIVATTTNELTIVGKGEITFTDTTNVSTFTVPSGITKVYIKLAGGGGGGGSDDTYSGGSGGAGQVVEGYATVNPGRILTMCIGAGGPKANGQTGGIAPANIWNAAGGKGGNAGTPGASGSGGAGGGASILKIGSVLFAAAGGGGGGGGGGQYSRAIPLTIGKYTNGNKPSASLPWTGGNGKSWGSAHDGGGGGGGGGGVPSGGIGGVVRADSNDNSDYGGTEGYPGTSTVPTGFTQGTTGNSAPKKTDGANGYITIKW